MQHEEIKQAINAKGLTIKIVAQALGKSPMAITNVMRRRLKSRPIAVALSKIIERPVEVVFPDQPKYHGSADEVQRRQQDEIRRLVNS